MVVPAYAIRAELGDTIRRRCQWTDEAGDGLDLSEATVTVWQAKPAGLTGASISWIDRAAGIFELTISDTLAAACTRGPTNWIRIRAVFPDGSKRASPEITVNVR
jgi:hypothetical protein